MSRITMSRVRLAEVQRELVIRAASKYRGDWSVRKNRYIYRLSSSFPFTLCLRTEQ